jgi:hypothetical protein
MKKKVELNIERIVEEALLIHGCDVRKMDDIWYVKTPKGALWGLQKPQQIRTESGELIPDPLGDIDDYLRRHGA